MLESQSPVSHAHQAIRPPRSAFFDSAPTSGPPPRAPTKSIFDQERLAGLDGLRGYAVLFVMFSHYYVGKLFGISEDRLITLGVYGVEIFFILSGFLITFLLLKEEREYGRIALGLFFGRRALRILPPVFFFLLTLVLLTGLGFFNIPVLDFIAGACFFRNYVTDGSPETGHLWTLAIEEHFYLAWPFFLVLISSKPARAVICGFIICAAPFWL